MTRFEAQLDTALKAVHAMPTPDVAKFWAAWAAEGGQPLPDLAAWHTACALAGDELILMDRLHGMPNASMGCHCRPTGVQRWPPGSVGAAWR